MNTFLIKKLLCCPVCKGSLQVSPKSLRCGRCIKKYPIIRGIPVFSEEIASTQFVSQEKIFNSEYSQIKEYTLHNWQQSFLNRLWQSFLLSNKRKSVLKGYYIDIGAGGPGYTVVETAKKGIISVGCDLSLTGMIKAKEFAKKQGVEKKCLFVVCDAENLPFKKDSFSYLSCIMLLEHLQNDKSAVKEISRISKKKARIFISVPNTYLLMWPFIWPLYKIWDRKLGHVRHYREKTLVEIFKKNKLKKVSVFYTVHLVKFLQMALSMILPASLKDRVWWRLEKIDFLQTKIKTGLNLNAIFEK